MPFRGSVVCEELDRAGYNTPFDVARETLGARS
jgi:hypothetical protein